MTTNRLSPNDPIKRLARSSWDDVIRIDLDGAFYCVHAALPMMRRMGGAFFGAMPVAGGFLVRYEL